MQELDVSRHRLAVLRLISDKKHALQTKFRNSLVFFHIHRHLKQPVRFPDSSIARRVSTADGYGSRGLGDNFKVVCDLSSDLVG